MKTLAVSVLAAAALVLSGCGTSTSSVKPDDVNPEGEIKPHEISWLLSRPVDGGVITAMKQIAADYAKDHEGFELKFITTPDRPSYIQKLETLAAANKLPELFDIDATPFAAKLAKKGSMVDVEAMLKDMGLYDDYRTSALDYQRFDDGSLYMVPFESQVEVFFYNKALLAKAGVDIPKTLDDIPQMCAALNKAGITPITMDGQDMWPLERFMAYYPFRESGNDYIKKLKKGEAKLSDETGRKAVQWMADLGSSGCFQEGFSSTGYADAQALFTSGKAAIYNTGSWDLPTLGTEDLDASVRDQIDYFLLPVTDGGATTQNEYVAPSGIGMAVNTKGYDPLVRDFLKYALEQYPKVYGATGQVNPTTGDGTTLPSNATDLYQRVVDESDNVGDVTAMPWDTQLDSTSNTRLQQELVLLVQGDVSVDEFIDTMDGVIAENGPKAFAE
ncbi:ABC transporter substrate-binding protein [Bifidobacterium amazonense]|nr:MULTISPECIES: ABC transporter substrate-binding protein [Bifidobacterium]MBT1173310.1 carbohydrate ABC transporter substrate-binding protein [Bifidobacterium santillanense]MCH9275730.1 ABC transporter substrate-binding protein [Bifidobacterium amazonense]